MWILTGTDNKASSCEHCGHAIATRFFITDKETKASLIVGSDCVQHFLNGSQKDLADRIIARYKKAAAQYRKQEPALLDEETRDQYIARRVKEMGNAVKGFKAFIAEYNNGVVWKTEARLKAANLTYERVQETRSDLDYGYGLAGSKLYSLMFQAEQTAMKWEIARATGSNPFDWSDKPIWKINNI